MPDGSRTKIIVSWAHGFVAGITVEATALNVEQAKELRLALAATERLAECLNRMRGK